MYIGEMVLGKSVAESVNTDYKTFWLVCLCQLYAELLYANIITAYKMGRIVCPVYLLMQVCACMCFFCFLLFFVCVHMCATDLTCFQTPPSFGMKCHVIAGSCLRGVPWGPRASIELFLWLSHHFPAASCHCHPCSQSVHVPHPTTLYDTITSKSLEGNETSEQGT